MKIQDIIRREFTPDHWDIIDKLEISLGGDRCSDNFFDEEIEEARFILALESNDEWIFSIPLGHFRRLMVNRRKATRKNDKLPKLTSSKEME